MESRVESLEKELSDTKQTLGTAVLKLIKKVTKLENKLRQKGFECWLTTTQQMVFEWLYKLHGFSSIIVVGWGRCSRRSYLVKAIHGGDGKIGKKAKSTFPSLWLDIVHVVELLKERGTLLADMRDRWKWSLEGSGDFSIASVRKLLDGNMLPEVASNTR
ncbi:hypothetical protein Tco_0693925 [Tanacetum coccineum]